MNSEIIEVLTKMLECEGTNSCNRDCSKCSLSTRMVDRSNALIMAIEALEKAEMNYLEIPDSWIPCSEGLPKEGYEVLITKEPFKIKGYEKEVIEAKRSIDPRSGKIEWWSPEFGSLTDESVLAWMEKPKPWKGEADGQTN